MILMNKLSCLWTIDFCLVASTLPYKVPTITDHTFIDEYVNAHNEMRGEVEPPAADMKYMSWDLGLAMIAKAWANKCIYKHNSCINQPNKCHPNFKYLGENIWKGGIRIFTPRAAVSLWYSEVEYYNYSTLHCSNICGHYTQVVWANSYKVGCAIKICPELGGPESSIFVCNYAPPGNYLGTPPYTAGEPCSMCEEEDTCQNKLCRNKERDKHQKYPNWKLKGKAPQQMTFNLLCLVYVLLRMF